MPVASMLGRLCNLYPGEGKKAFQFCLLAFFCGLGVYGGATLSDGLFLEKIGNRGLPLTYFITACCMFLVASLLLYSLNRFSVRLIFFTLILIEAACYGLISLQLLGSATGLWVWYAAKILSYMFLLVMLTGLWTFFDECYDLQDAKRLYGMLMAAIISGAACSGYLVSFLLPLLRPSGLFALISGALLLALWFAFVADRWIIESEEPFESFRSEHQSIGNLIGQIVSSPFTIYLLLFGILVLMLEVVTEYNYMSALESIFGAKENLLTRFLGISQGWVYVGAVLISVTFYGRLVQRIGVNNLALLTPIAFLLLFSVWPFHSGLTMALFGLVLVEGVRDVITDSNFNLAINAVPSRLKAKIRIASEYFVEPFGMLIGSALLSIFRSETKLLGLGIATCALIVVLFLRRAYPKAMFKNLTESAIRFDRKVGDWLCALSTREQQQTEQILMENLLLKGPCEIKLMAFQALLAFENRELLPDLLCEMKNCSQQTVLSMIKLLKSSCFANDPLVVEPLPQEESNEIPLYNHDAYGLIKQLRSTHNALLRSVCLQRLREICDERHLSELVLASIHLRPTERREMEKLLVGLGHSATARLLAMTRDVGLDDRCRSMAGRALGRLSRPTLRSYLYPIILEEVERAYFYHYHYETVQKRYPQHDLELLRDGLLSGFHSVMDFLIHLLGVASELDDCELLCKALRSDNQKLHSQAVETLEKSCGDKRIFRLLLPLIDDRPKLDKLRLYIKGGRTPYSLPELLGRLERSASSMDSLVATSMRADLSLPGWDASIEQTIELHPFYSQLAEA